MCSLHDAVSTVTSENRDIVPRRSARSDFRFRTVGPVATKVHSRRSLKENIHTGTMVRRSRSSPLLAPRCHGIFRESNELTKESRTVGTRWLEKSRAQRLLAQLTDKSPAYVGYLFAVSRRASFTSKLKELNETYAILCRGCIYVRNRQGVNDVSCSSFASSTVKRMVGAP